MKECINCGALVDDVDLVCKYCSHSFASPQAESGSKPEAAVDAEFWNAPAPEAPEPPVVTTAEERRQAGPQQPPESAAQNIPPQYGAPQQPAYAEQQGSFYGQGQPYTQQQPPYGQQQQQYQQPYQGQQQYPPQQGQYNTYQVNVNQQYNQPFTPPPGMMYIQKDKTAAGVLGILLGWIGVHKFYLGKIGQGIVYVLFCWTGIPAIVGFIEGIIYLCSDDETFCQKYCWRRY